MIPGECFLETNMGLFRRIEEDIHDHFNVRIKDFMWTRNGEIAAIRYQRIGCFDGKDRIVFSFAPRSPFNIRLIGKEFGNAVRREMIEHSDHYEMNLGVGESE